MPTTIRTGNRTGLTQSDISKKFRVIEKALNHVLVEREKEIRLCLLAILSQSNYLMMGPAGEGKTYTVENVFKCFSDVSSVVRELNGETRASNLFGIPAASEMNQGSMRLDLSETMAASQLIYLDEIGKASSTLMGVLMKLANTRQFDNFGEIVDCPVLSIIASSNEPPRKEVEGFPNRFALKSIVKPVTWTARMAYVENSDKTNTISIKPEHLISEDILLDSFDAISAIRLPPKMISTACQIGMTIDGSLSSDASAKICTIDTRKWVWAMKILKAYIFFTGIAPAYSHLAILADLFWDEPKHSKTVMLAVTEFLKEKTSMLTSDSF
jgi:MoxR-like ATPase